MHVEAGDSKLLLFETFSLFYFFFTGAIPRGARAPKNNNIGFREHGFFLQVIFAKCEDFSKVKIFNTSALGPKKEVLIISTFNQSDLKITCKENLSSLKPAFLF